MPKRGRKQSNPVHNHFKFDDISNTSTCIHCNKSIPRKHSTNLLAHMKCKHPEITIQEEDEQECAPIEKSKNLQGSLKLEPDCETASEQLGTQNADQDSGSSAINVIDAPQTDPNQSVLMRNTHKLLQSLSPVAAFSKSSESSGLQTPDEPQDLDIRKAADGLRGIFDLAMTKSLLTGYQTDRISIALSKDQFLNSLVDLCTINLCPFSIVEYSGFKTIIDPICNAFKLSINRKSISTLIIERANKMRKNLSEKLSERKFFIKADICTRLGRTVLGINVQFIHEWKLEIKNLAVIELFEPHSGKYLEGVLSKVLNRFDLLLTQVIGVITDNGKNITKMSKLLPTTQSSIEHQEPLRKSNSASSARSNLPTKSASSFSSIEFDISNEDDNISLSRLKELDTFNESDSNLETEEFNEVEFEDEQIEMNTFPLQSISCAAHTFHSAIHDILENVNSKKIISDTRSLAIKLRVPSMRRVS